MFKFVVLSVCLDQHESLQCFQCFITFCNSKAKERHMKKSHREEYKQQLQQVSDSTEAHISDYLGFSHLERSQFDFFHQ